MLLPERATGIELDLEQRLGEDGQLGEVGTTLLQRRRITAGCWRRPTPANAGGARVQGLGLDGRWALGHTAPGPAAHSARQLGPVPLQTGRRGCPNGLPGRLRAVPTLGFDVHSALWPLT